MPGAMSPMQEMIFAGVTELTEFDKLVDDAVRDRPGELEMYHLALSARYPNWPKVSHRLFRNAARTEPDLEIILPETVNGTFTCLVHKGMVATPCEHFRDVLASDPECKAITLEPGFDYGVLESALSFLYAGVLPTIDTGITGYNESYSIHYRNLHNFALKYGIPSLADKAVAALTQKDIQWGVQYKVAAKLSELVTDLYDGEKEGGEAARVLTRTVIGIQCLQVIRMTKADLKEIAAEFPDFFGDVKLGLLEKVEDDCYMIDDLTDDWEVVYN